MRGVNFDQGCFFVDLKLSDLSSLDVRGRHTKIKNYEIGWNYLSQNFDSYLSLGMPLKFYLSKPLPSTLNT